MFQAQVVLALGADLSGCRAPTLQTRGRTYAQATTKYPACRLGTARCVRDRVNSKQRVFLINRSCRMVPGAPQYWFWRAAPPLLPGRCAIPSQLGGASRSAWQHVVGAILDGDVECESVAPHA